MEAVNAFDAAELAEKKDCLSDFFFKIALQVQARLPNNPKILKQIAVFDPRNIFAAKDVKALGSLATQLATVGQVGYDISTIEADWRRLRHTTMDVNSSTPMFDFWAHVAKVKSGDDALFPEITRLVSAFISLPISNTTVERLFSVMSVIKTKLQNTLAIPMVESILGVRYSLQCQNETCVTMAILPEMLS